MSGRGKYLDDAIAAVVEHERRRPRSSQDDVGWSEVGGCQAALWFRLHGYWATDEPDVARAAEGTALHEWWTGLMSARHPERRYEVDTTYRGIPGHADEVDPTEPSVTDLKTMAVRKIQRMMKVRIPARRDHELWRPKLMQVHGYGAGLVEAGVLPERHTVRLLLVPVDGGFGEWQVHEEPFDVDMANEGADRRDRVAASPETPACDSSLVFCSAYCQFHDMRPTEGGTRA